MIERLRPHQLVAGEASETNHAVATHVGLEQIIIGFCLKCK